MQPLRRVHARGGLTLPVAPSILSADFFRLGAQVQEVVDAGATAIHVDVMDGRFVPPITMGPMVVDALRSHLGEDIDLDVHLMIEAPERQIEAFAQAGATGITLHVEATAHVHFALDRIREAGCRAGLAFNPGTPPAALGEVTPDLALCMTVNPGWGGQKFIDASVEKVRRMRALLGDGPALEVDGGIDATTAPRVAEAGADWFVAGSAVFGADDPAEAYRRIADAAGSR